MGFTTFLTKRSAHSKKKDGKTTVEAGPPKSNGTSNDRPSLFPSPLALNPPNQLHGTPRPKGQEDSAQIVAGNFSAITDLSLLVDRAGRLTKIVSELTKNGTWATERSPKMDGADIEAVDGSVADQAHTQERPHTSSSEGMIDALSVLPATVFRTSLKSNEPRLPAKCTNTTQKSSCDSIRGESMAESSSSSSSSIVPQVGFQVPADAGCDACTACFETCPTCYKADNMHTTGCDLCRAGVCSAQPKIKMYSRRRNPSAAQLARLDKRPVPLGYDLASPASICPSLADTEAPADKDEDVAEICEVTNLGVVHSCAKVVDIDAVPVKSECCSFPESS